MAEEDSNHRVTNAILKRDLEHLLSEFKEFTAEIKENNRDHEARIRTLEGNQRSIMTRQDNIDTRVKAWSITNSVAAAVAAVLAAIGLRQ